MTRKIRYKEISPELSRMVSPNFDVLPRASVGMEKFVGEYFFIDVEKLIPFRNQARRIFDQGEIEQLSKTIREHGIRQPLTVLKSDDKEGCFEVISGERRLRAAVIVGLKTVPCIIMHDPALAEEIAVIENIQRADLHPIELGKALKKILHNARWGGQGDLAEKIGIKQSSLSEFLKFAELPDEIVDAILTKNLRSRSLLRAVSRAETAEQMRDVLLGGAKTDKKGSLQKREQLSENPVLRIDFADNGYVVQVCDFTTMEKLDRESLKQILFDLWEQL